MLYDISRPITADMAVYKNRDSKRIRHTWVARLPEDSVNESEWSTNLHTGTHVDAPLHMLEDGGSIDTVDPALYWGPCRVLDLSTLTRPIEAKDLEPYRLEAGERILLKTRNSFTDAYDPEFIYIEESAADHLVACGVRMVGIDAMSVERGKDGHPTHRTLLGAGIGILEDVRLADVPEGRYHLTAVPLLLHGMEASPVRALLHTLEDTAKQSPTDGYTYFPFIR